MNLPHFFVRQVFRVKLAQDVISLANTAMIGSIFARTFGLPVAWWVIGFFWVRVGGGDSA